MPVIYAFDAGYDVVVDLRAMRGFLPSLADIHMIAGTLADQMPSLRGLCYPSVTQTPFSIGTLR